MHLIGFFLIKIGIVGLHRSKVAKVRDAILNINTYFVTYVVVVGFGSWVVRREFRNP